MKQFSVNSKLCLYGLDISETSSMEVEPWSMENVNLEADLCLLICFNILLALLNYTNSNIYLIHLGQISWNLLDCTDFVHSFGKTSNFWINL